MRCAGNDLPLSIWKDVKFIQHTCCIWGKEWIALDVERNPSQYYLRTNGTDVHKSINISFNDLRATSSQERGGYIWIGP